MVYIFQDSEGCLGKIFDCRNAIEHDCLVIRHAIEKLPDRGIVAVHQKSMILEIDQMGLGKRLDVGKIHDHPVIGLTVCLNYRADQRDEQRIAVPVQVATLAFVIRNAVAGVELQLAGNRQHGVREFEEVYGSAG